MLSQRKLEKQRLPNLMRKPNDERETLNMNAYESLSTWESRSQCNLLDASVATEGELPLRSGITFERDGTIRYHEAPEPMPGNWDASKYRLKPSWDSSVKSA